LLFLCTTLLGGCAVGNAHRYSDTVVDINSPTTRSVAFTVYDQREYVMSGNKTPDFAGLSRGGFGNPFDVTTESKKPLTEEMTLSIAATFKKNGIKAIPVVVAFAGKRSNVIEKLKATGGERLLLLTVFEWKSDTYSNTSLHFDVNAEVLDREGKTLAEKRSKGVDELGGSAWNPPAYAKDAVRKAFKEKVETLLNSMEIGTALQ
jgi:hypothetical protein